MSNAKQSQKPEPFTGVAFTAQCHKQSGVFNNFKVCTLFIEDGKIIHVEKSDPYCSVDAVVRAVGKLDRSIMNLGSRYKEGDYCGLAGEDRDDLLKLRAKDPEILSKIKRVLGMERKIA